MADILSLIHQITGFTQAFRQVVTDGIDVFWVSNDDANSIYKYDVSGNTHAKFIDASAFKISTGIISLIVFKRNIYVGTIDFGQAFPLALCYVFQVTPSGTVTEVLSDFPRSVHTQPGGSGIDGVNFRLYSTEDVIVAAYHERRNFPGPPPEPAEFLSMHSTDGTTWSNSTDTFTETVEIQNVGLADAQTEGKDFRILGIYERYPVTTNAENIVLQFVTDTWSKVRGPEKTSAFNLDVSLFEVAADHFWNADDFGHYTSDWITYHEPTSRTASMVGLNMPFATVESDLTNDIFFKLDTDNPPTGQERDSEMATLAVATGTRTIQMIRLNDGKGLMFCVPTGATFPDWTVWERDNDLPATPTAWGQVANYSPPTMPLPCSIDADGTFIYIAALTGASSIPVLLKLDTDLLSDATLVFEPGAGTDIGVICGREDADTIWVGGNFGGTNVLEKSIDAGSTFVVKDDSTFGIIEAFAVGPDSDDRVIIADDNVNIEETIDSGGTWVNINTGVGFNINTIARLATDVKESVFGNDAGATDNIDYSLDSGANMEDFTTGVFPIIDDVTDVIIN